MGNNYGNFKMRYSRRGVTGLYTSWTTPQYARRERKNRGTTVEIFPWDTNLSREPQKSQCSAGTKYEKFKFRTPKNALILKTQIPTSF